MRRFAIFALALALTGATACDDDIVGPSSTPIVFTVDLAASNEVPPVGNAESGATGRATITFQRADQTARATPPTAGPGTCRRS